MTEAFTRKDFLRLGLARLVGAASDAADLARGVVAAARERTAPPPEGLVRPPGGLVRPPGALPERAFLDKCTRCDACIRACPHFVVRKAGPELGARIGGTPVLDPRENPCRFCDGLPCIAACEPGALVAPAAGAKARIGLARVDKDRCFMALGQPCDYCQKSCPVRPRAIKVGGFRVPAVVDAATCTGCGECAQICPAKAVRIQDTRLEVKA
ncbi:MAG: 4Fe-4S dicluster domain-containing protein [Planctomycetota bacterium]